ncbi:hypothetical protein [Streptomyces sp. NPDC055013]
MMGIVAVGCADAGDTADPRSAEELVGDATRTMKGLSSVAMVTDITTKLNEYSSRWTTDLKSRCTLKATTSSGSEMEQIRIGETDYIHPNDVYLEMWGRETVPAMRDKPWLKSPVSAAMGADDLADCAWPFDPSGEATKSKPTVLDGKPVIPVKVQDSDLDEGTYTFYVAAEGKPYLLRLDYQTAHHRRIMKFSGFNERLDIQPPAAADVLDLSSLPPDAS